jgi:hypothetical protein
MVAVVGDEVERPGAIGDARGQLGVALIAHEHLHAVAGLRRRIPGDLDGEDTAAPRK